MKPVPSDSELRRLQDLRSLGILDTEREQQFDDITTLASSVCETPIALITLVDEKRIWFKSRIGLPMPDAPRGSWFCEEAIRQKEIFVVADGLNDERFQANPLVASGPKVRFYAGIPLSPGDEQPIGTLCVLDTKPRELTQHQKKILQVLGRQVNSLLAARKNLSAILDELSINKELAGAASKVKSSFLANMSHEIRTPMTAILGMTDLLLSGELKKDQRDYIETIRTSGESLLNIINDILDFSKIESGKMELDIQPVDLQACIEDTLDVVSPKAHEQGDELLYAMDSTVPHRITADGARLRQILVNLFNNAIKFTRNGEIVLSVHVQQHIGNDIDLMFSVKDTGIGIPKDKLELIFEAFTQADSSVTRKYGGAGLGLVICSRLASMMGGRIGVESAEGKGSNFFFTIRATPLVGQAQVQGQARSAELEGKRILIVDDSATNLRVLSAECKQWGMIPCTFDSPVEALASIKKGDPFDLAIFDMQMPDKDGVQLALETRELRQSSQLPIILLSSWDLGDPRIKDHHALFAATVMKPLKISQFQSLLKSVIAKQNSTNAGAPKTSKTIERLAEEIPVSIIVAEDNHINQKLIQRMLRSMGYEPTIVGTGLEVLNALEKAACDILFMDVQMPEMDGLEATQKIRQRYGLNSTPKIIAMTAFALAGDKEKCIQAGMDDYLSKPFVSDQVASMIRKWAGGLKGPMIESARKDEGPRKEIDAAMQVRIRELENETERTFVKELVTIFLNEAPTNFQTMKDAMGAKDAKTIEQYAHKLKGGSINLGAEQLSHLFEKVEALARKNAHDISDSLIVEIDQEFDRTLRHLHSYVAAP